MEDDKLNTLLALQYNLQKSLGNIDKINSNPAMRQQYINQMILAIHEETTEIMRETAYKNPNFVPFGWKKGQTENTERFKNEIIDIMHFIFNLCIVSGMDADEIYTRYINKNKKNKDRQKQGY